MFNSNGMHFVILIVYRKICAKKDFIGNIAISNVTGLSIIIVNLLHQYYIFRELSLPFSARENIYNINM